MKNLQQECTTSAKIWKLTINQYFSNYHQYKETLSTLTAERYTCISQFLNFYKARDKAQEA